MAINGTKRRKLAHDSSDDEAQGTASRKAQKDFFKQASSWDLEDDYASRRRKSKKSDKESTKLPIKTADGRLEILRELEKDEDLVSVESDTEWLQGREDDIESEVEEEEEEVQEEAPTVSEAQQIREAQEELAKLATSLNEDPEEHVGSLKTVAAIGESPIPAIQMLALMTQMSVYKDIIPGYRIRPASENDPAEKVSKDVRTLRQFEQALVLGYQNYVKELARCAKLEANPVKGGQSVAGIAITCACTLIAAVPHFNFRSDLLRILVNKLSRKKIDNSSVKCLKALETLFREDEDGKPTMEAVSLLSKMMKAREYQVDESVVNLFLSLRLLSEFAGKASHDAVGRTAVEKKKKWEYRSKRERKAKKEQKSLEKDMAAADAMVDHEERDKMQSETLKLVFASYFRILKMRAPHLMGAVLEGLAKYAHLINQDFFGDLLEALKDLIRHSDDDDAADLAVHHEDDDGVSMRNLTREALLCTVTAFALLQGQDAHNSRNNLHLDLTFFTTHLFTSLLSLSVHPDLELTKVARHNNNKNSNTSTTSKINVQTTTVLLLRSLTAILLPAWNIRSVPPLKLAAFTKQLMTAALQLPDKSCQATLCLLSDMAHTHGKKIASLWNTEERKGDGKHNALSDTVEGSNPFAATVWEGELLKKHFSPKVREGAKLLVKTLP